MNNYKKMHDILLAGAIGDALGYIVEFDNEYFIKSKYGQNGIQLSNLSNTLVVSDDTQMTLFCLNAIIPYLNTENLTNNIANLELINDDIYKNYTDWLYTQTNEFDKATTVLAKYPELYKRQAPGHTCLTALIQSLEDESYGSLTRKVNYSKGCGGIMRTAPVAFLNLNLEDTFKLGAMQAAITHTHPDGYLNSGFFSGLIKHLSEGFNLDEALSQNLQILRNYQHSENLLRYIDKVVLIAKNSDLLIGDKLNSVIGLGWTGDEALGVALYSFLKADNFEQCLNLATNHSGDSDSTASLAAQLYASKYGLEEQYYHYLEQLDIKQPFKALLETLYDITHKTKNNNLAR